MQNLLYGLFSESPWNSESVQIPYKIINDSLWAKLTCFPYNNIYIICYHYNSHPIRSVSSPDDHCSPEHQWSLGHQMSPRDRSPVRTLSPRHPSEKEHWNQLSPYNLTLLQLEQTAGSSGQRGTGPPTEPGFSQGFFLHSVTDGVLVPCRCRLWLA